MANRLEQFQHQQLVQLRSENPNHPDIPFLQSMFDVTTAYIIRNQGQPIQVETEITDTQLDLSKIPYEVDSSDEDCLPLLPFIASLDLPPRTLNAIVRFIAREERASYEPAMQVRTIRDFYTISYTREIARIRNVGKNSVDQIVKKLYSYQETGAMPYETNFFKNQEDIGITKRIWNDWKRRKLKKQVALDEETDGTQ